MKDQELIIFECGSFFVVREHIGKSDYHCVYKNGATAATRIATFGFQSLGLQMAIDKAKMLNKKQLVRST